MHSSEGGSADFSHIVSELEKRSSETYMRVSKNGMGGSYHKYSRYTVYPLGAGIFFWNIFLGMFWNIFGKGYLI